MTVAFAELAGSPIESYGPEGVQAQRHLLCAWDDRRALVREVLGDGYEGRANYPGTAHVVAMRARVEALGDDMVTQSLTELTEGLNAYRGFAKVTIDYELVAPAARSDLPSPPEGTILAYRLVRSWETMTLPGDDLEWEGQPTAAVPTGATGAIRIPVAEHRLTWRRVACPPWAAIRAATGTVNSETFLGAAAETLLFDGATAQPEFLGISEADEAQFTWRIEYVFREKTAKLLIPEAMPGWNHQYRSEPTEAAGWDRLHSTAVSEHYLYRHSDFNALFEYEEE